MAICVFRYSDTREITSSPVSLCSFNMSMQNSLLGHLDAFRAYVLKVSSHKLPFLSSIIFKSSEFRYKSVSGVGNASLRKLVVDIIVY